MDEAAQASASPEDATGVIRARAPLALCSARRRPVAASPSRSSCSASDQLPRRTPLALRLVTARPSADCNGSRVTARVR